MTKGTILALDDLTLDKTIKIQGTEHDRKRKLTDKQVEKAKKMYAKGQSLEHIAYKFGVHKNNIKYNIDPEYRSYMLQHNSGKHGGVQTMLFEDRVQYKKTLIAHGKVSI